MPVPSTRPFPPLNGLETLIHPDVPLTWTPLPTPSKLAWVSRITIACLKGHRTFSHQCLPLEQIFPSPGRPWNLDTSGPFTHLDASSYTLKVSVGVENSDCLSQRASKLSYECMATCIEQTYAIVPLKFWLAATTVAAIHPRAAYLGMLACYVGTLARYVGSLARYVGTLTPYVAPYVGMLAPYAGMLTSYVGTLAPYVGTLALHVGTLTAYVGTLALTGHSNFGWLPQSLPSFLGARHVRARLI
mmetsp:Transcript_19888/g.34213  ORF Transcript_19888/g.34213 Transcript_19888/m.34213 type:complete len:245 (-) Transcript_19888:37-771(-)